MRRLSSVPDEVCLVLVVAAAGYGKTTAVRQWARTTRGPVVWVHLTKEHQDRQRLAADLAVALQGTAPVEDGRDGLSASPSDVLPEGAAGRLATAAAARAPLTIVLDDLHLLRTHAALDLVLALAVRLPPRCRVVAIADRQPRLQITRLRDDGRCIDLGPADLAFSPAETAAFLRRSDLHLDAEAIADLQQRTEGWPAGLQLASLALRTGSGSDGDMREIDGNNRLVADYFRDVVLSSLSPEIVRFLMRTAVLDRMSASLCDSVLGSNGSTAWLGEVRELGLFIIPLDEAGEWFRYQRFFAEMLRGELRRREPGEDLRILRAASLWYDAHGLPEEAIRHAVASEDALLAARLVVTHARQLIGRGRVRQVRALLDRLDHHVLELYPPVAVTAAWIRVLTGDAAGALQALRIAERASFDAVMPDGSASFTSAVAMARAALAPAGVDAMLADAERAVALEPVNSSWYAPARLLQGLAHVLRGSIREGNAAFDQVIGEAAADQRLAVSFALGMRSLAAEADGEWTIAAACATRARAMVDSDLWNSLTSIMAFTAAARVALHRGDTQQALHQLREAERLYRDPSPAAVPWMGVLIAVLLGRSLVALGDMTAAEHRLTDARRALALLPTHGVLSARVEALAAELDAAGGRNRNGSAIDLTAAEVRVLALLTTHHTLGEIGDELEVSRNTVKTQVAAIYHKLGVGSRSDAVRRAYELGLLGA